MYNCELIKYISDIQGYISEFTRNIFDIGILISEIRSYVRCVTIPFIFAMLSFIFQKESIEFQAFQFIIQKKSLIKLIVSFLV